MRTNIVLDDDLVREAMRMASIRTKREIVDLALREFVARRRQRDILTLAEEGLIDPQYDVRAVRAGMTRDPG